jgi:polyhydroxyalkanoate synthesis regulator phasin
MEEKMRILNLLKEGKITTDEAARLLDAVDQKSEDKEHREHHIRFKKHFMPGIEVMPETITKAMATAMAKLQ